MPAGWVTIFGTSIRAALVRRDITPPLGIDASEWGAATHDVSEGTHRPMVVTVLALSSVDGGAPLIPAAVDQIEFGDLVKDVTRFVADAVADEMVIDSSQGDDRAFAHPLILVAHGESARPTRWGPPRALHRDDATRHRRSFPRSAAADGAGDPAHRLDVRVGIVEEALFRGGQGHHVWRIPTVERHGDATDALGELLTVDRVPVDAHSLEIGFQLSTVRQRVWGSRRERVRAQVLIPEIGWRESQERFAGCACMRRRPASPP